MVVFGVLAVAALTQGGFTVERADLGVCEGSLSAVVAPHASRFYRLDAEKRVDREVYEAESAYLAAYQELDPAEKAGTPFFRQSPTASGGVMVANLGGSRDNDLVWKDIRISAEGKYRFDLSYQADERRSFYMQIDYGPVVAVSVDVTKGQSKSHTVELPLSAGMHTVRLFNAVGRMPDVDSLIVTRQ